MDRINATMLTLARESRGITQTELAEAIGTTQGNVGKLERSENGVSSQWLNGFAEATGYPVSFFFQKGGTVPGNLNYRRREKVPQAIMSPLNARINIYRLQLQTLTADLDLKPIKITRMEVTDKNDAGQVAQKLRKQWQVPAGTVDNMTRILEDNGIAVFSFDFGTDRVDSRCLLTENGFPVIFVNGRLPGDRQRFSLAYELGHLMMHSGDILGWDRDTNHEAKLFAAEFLMPGKEVRKDLEAGVSISLLAKLKRQWKVSMISLLYRADDLGLLAVHEKRQLIQEFNELQIRRREPVQLDIPVEQPTLIKQWTKKWQTTGKRSAADLAERLHLHSDEFVELYGEG
jgi:Zn-dependent peptidase ImmA (M78 family)